MRKSYILFLFLAIFSTRLQAQIEEAIPSSSVNYKVLDDNPKDLNTLWVHVQPITVDAIGMNIVVGSGLEFNYNPIPKWDFRAGFRGNFINTMDLQRNAATHSGGITTQESKREQGQLIITNTFSRFYNVDLGASYAISDKEKKGTTKVVLLESAEQGVSAMPEIIEIDCKVRHIWSARLGLQSMATTVSLQKAMDKQDVSLKGDKGTVLSSSGTTTSNGFKTATNHNEVFSNFFSTGFNVGGSLQLVKNVSIKTEKQGVLSNNSILTVYADVLMAPWTKIEDINTRKVGDGTEETFDASPIKLNQIGGRIGMDMRFNQSAYLSYGIEAGVKPSIQGQGLYLVAKLGIPVFSFGASKHKVATNVGQNQSLTQ